MQVTSGHELRDEVNMQTEQQAQQVEISTESVSAEACDDSKSVAQEERLSSCGSEDTNSDHSERSVGSAQALQDVSGSDKDDAESSLANWLAAHQLGQFAERIFEYGCEDLEFLRQMELEEVEEMADAVKMKPVQERKLCRSLGWTLQGH